MFPFELYFMSYVENSQKNLPSLNLHNYKKSFKKKEELKMDLLGLCLNLIATAIAYLFVPIIFCANKKNLTKGKIILITFLNGLCVWFIFTVIKIELEIEQTSGAVLLWSTVAYFLMKKYCLNNGDSNESLEENEQIKESEPIEKNKPIKKYVVTQVKKTNLANTQTQKQKKKKQPLIFVTVALSILLIGSVTYNVIQYTIIQNRTESIKYLEENVLPAYIEEEPKPSFSEWSDAKNNSFTEEFLRLVEEGKEPHIYDYDPETNRYLDEVGNVYIN